MVEWLQVEKCTSSEMDVVCSAAAKWKKCPEGKICAFYQPSKPAKSDVPLSAFVENLNTPCVWKVSSASKHNSLLSLNYSPASATHFSPIEDESPVVQLAD
jgi:hypothetical protein